MYRGERHSLAGLEKVGMTQGMYKNVMEVAPL